MRTKHQALREPVAWMIHYGCGCAIPCTVRVADTWCPKHDEDGPVVSQVPLFDASAADLLAAEAERVRDARERCDGTRRVDLSWDAAVRWLREHGLPEATPEEEP